MPFRFFGEFFFFLRKLLGFLAAGDCKQQHTLKDLTLELFVRMVERFANASQPDNPANPTDPA